MPRKITVLFRNNAHHDMGSSSDLSSLKTCTSLVPFLCHIFQTDIGGLANKMSVDDDYSFTSAIVGRLVQNRLVTNVVGRFSGIGSHTIHVHNVEYPRLQIPMIIYRKDNGENSLLFMPMDWVNIVPIYLVE